MGDKRVISSEIVETTDGRKSGGQVIGINLGWDFCAEHEWGIEKLNLAFGIPGKPERRRGVRGLVSGDLVGADTRTAIKVPNDLKFFENLDGYAYLLFASSFGWMEESELTAEQFNNMIEARDGEELATAWSKKDFGVRMKNDVLNVGTSVLGQIYDAFVQRDAMIFLSGQSNPFGNRGLILAIRSRMPEEVLNQMKEADEDYLNLLDAVEATGIEEQLKKADKRYYALSPRWATSSVKSRFPVVFLLNPCEQRENNWGWFTVEDLLDWIDGNRGPIPKTKSTV
jgi:hypothetical protein